jgi:hypothetical protein
MIATPHSGSSYLSLPEFAPTIFRAMRLSGLLPESLRKQLQVNSTLLRSMADDFKAIAADLAIWTLYETEDTDLTILMTNETPEIPLLAPIASIRSALLNLYHENDYPMSATHLGCASFSGENTQTKLDFLEDLKQAVDRAHGLSKIKHNDLKLRELVEVEVHGFYKGVPQSPGSEVPIRLWSIRKSLQFFAREGPSRCLQERMEEVSVPPQPHQYLSSSAARAVSLDSRPLDNLPISNNSLERGSPQAPPIGGTSSVGVPRSPRRFFRSTRSDEGTRQNRLPFEPRRRDRPTLPRNSSQTKDIPRVAREPIPEESLPGTTSPIPSIGVLEASPDIVAQATPLLQADVGPSSFLSTDVTGTRSVASIDFAQMDTNAHLATSVDEIARSRSLSLPGPESPSTALRPTEVLAERRDSTSTFSTLPPTRLLKPDISDRKLTWIHVPFNNPVWVSVGEHIPIDRPR